MGGPASEGGPYRSKGFGVGQIIDSQPKAEYLSAPMSPGLDLSATTLAN